MFLVENKLAIVFLTHNNAKHIKKSLDSIKQPCDIYITDSGSNDDTISIVKPYAKDVFINIMDIWDAGAQRNFAYKKLKNKYEWILFLDSDEGLTDNLSKEIINLMSNKNYCSKGYSIRSNYRLFNKTLHNINKNTFHDRLICGNLVSDNIFTSSPGEVFNNRNLIRPSNLKEGYWHDVDAKGFLDWLKRVSNYQFQNGETDSLYFFSNKQRDVKNFSFIRKNRIYLTIFLPLLYFSYYIFVRRAYLDGLSGIIFAVIMSSAYIFYPFGFILGMFKRVLRVKV